MSDSIPWGPTGEVVYQRTYSRTKTDGSRETWPETVTRVVDGNLALVHGTDKSAWPVEVLQERERLLYYMHRFAILPGGRHLWATGVEGRQYLFNCHVAGWGDKLSDHFEFSFLRLMEGGGVGANYSTKHIARFGHPTQPTEVHIVCDPGHPDIEELRPYLSPTFRPSTGMDYSGDVPVRPPGWHPADGAMVVDSREGWADAMVAMIDQSYGVGALVFDVSGVRWSGAELKTFGGTASGPGPFARMMHEIAKILTNSWSVGILSPIHVMEMDHAIAECVVSGGNRRSARMAIVHWDDDYVRDFIECKTDTGKHWTTNISVEVDDEFFAQLKDPDSWASHVHRHVTAAMLTNGEPGYWNSSLAQTGEVGEVIATNPCGEIALEAWENCNLGHINLDAFAPRSQGERFDYQGMQEAHRLITRFLIRATYGDVNDPKQAVALARNRRIGVGHLGVHGFWAKLGVKYSELPTAAGVKDMLDLLYRIVRDTAGDYAFDLRIPEPVKVTCVAPTGSISKLPGVSSGADPIYAKYFENRVRFSKRDAGQANSVLEFMEQGFAVEDDIYDSSGQTAVVVFPTEDILLGQVRALGWPEDVVESADEISVRDMLAVQELYQTHWADNAVSYTVNIPDGSITADELGWLLTEFLPGLKGTTIMVDASRPQAPYTRITKEQYQAAEARRVADSVDELCASGACPVR